MTVMYQVTATDGEELFFQNTMTLSDIARSLEEEGMTLDVEETMTYYLGPELMEKHEAVIHDMEDVILEETDLLFLRSAVYPDFLNSLYEWEEGAVEVHREPFHEFQPLDSHPKPGDAIRFLKPMYIAGQAFEEGFRDAIITGNLNETKAESVDVSIRPRVNLELLQTQKMVFSAGDTSFSMSAVDLTPENQYMYYHITNGSEHRFQRVRIFGYRPLSEGGFPHGEDQPQ